MIKDKNQFEAIKTQIGEINQEGGSINDMLDVAINSLGFETVKNEFENQDIFPLDDAISVCKENIDNVLYDCYEFETIQDLNYKLDELINQCDDKFVYYSDLDIEMSSDIDEFMIIDMLDGLYDEIF